MERMSLPKVVWLKSVRTRYGKSVQRIEATLIAMGDEYCTIELADGERRAAKVEDVKLLRAAKA